MILTYLHIKIKTFSSIIYLQDDHVNILQDELFCNISIFKPVKKQWFTK